MKLEKVLADLNFNMSQDALASIQPFWEEAISSLPDKQPDFLNPASFKCNREFCGLEPELDMVLEQTARAIMADPALLALVWYCCRRTYNHPEIEEEYNDWPWPSLEKALPEKQAGMIRLLIVLAMVPLVQSLHQHMGIPESITRDTCLQIKCFVENNKKGNDGLPGVFGWGLFWIRHYVGGRMFRLGRMEYKLKTLSDFPVVFRHKKAGEILAFAGPGQCFNREGLVAGPDEREKVWISSLSENELIVKGNPLSPYGMALPEEITLDKNDWHYVLGKESIVLDMHIPSGSGMDPDTCLDSMQRAFEFFTKYFPEQPAKAIVCWSWIFNTQLEELLPDSNLVKFMRELYLFPIKSSGRDGLNFIFCRNYDDWSKAPRETSLQRALLGIIESGRKLRQAGMFIFKQDLSHFGTQFYRRLLSSSKSQVSICSAQIPDRGPGFSTVEGLVS